MLVSVRYTEVVLDATVRVGPAADVYVARDSSASDHPFETSVPPL